MASRDPATAVVDNTLRGPAGSRIACALSKERAHPARLPESVTTTRLSTPPGKMKPRNEQQQQQQQRTHKVEESDPTPLSTGASGVGLPAATPSVNNLPTQLPLPVDYNIYELGMYKKVEPYLTKVTINGATLQMEIDTGSALTLISQATFSKLWPGDNSPHLERTPIRLRTYSGEELRVVGRAVVRVRCGGQEDLGLVVVGGG